jgi:hypothetical protein
MLAKVAALTLAPWVVRQKMFLLCHHATQGVKVSIINTPLIGSCVSDGSCTYLGSL